ncbi:MULTISPECIES: PCMD domain-containing protein [unclassified Dysgonomonas]|jgi:hypothetical protein|uniref:PCMD domain-containing protein n=1 Tax=unclassified Dysgonomonas TaxID=2630389 RepID=UPI0025C45472|nr:MULTISPECIES: PCMD domain-containing protein [unclassified Dysgonomonas]MDR2002997.1 PCMD domain-containing protein [Prevotella sp.]HMM03885.1 PCMD domain-containing protein [Dysgonomonas sp.]
MRSKSLLALNIVIALTLNSCIQDEPLNREADITDVKVEGDTFISSIISEANNEINIFVTSEADITNLTPVIELSPGATVSPASGIAMDFTEGQKYKVTSEDGNYSKEYTITVTSNIDLKYDFEDWGEAGVSGRKYPILLSNHNAWSTGNSGVAIVVNANPYPTEKTTDSYAGTYAAKLQTIKGLYISVTGQNIPIFAGSLFLGEFSANITNPLLSLKLGRMYSETNGKPVTFTGYYKYTPGDVFTDKDGNPVAGRVDECSIYAVIFKVSKGSSGHTEYLNGETVSTSDKVIARAEWSRETSSITDEEVNKGFYKFTIPFVYTENFDFTKNNYKLTIVLSSSQDGNLYEGAIGSTLIVDELEILTESF